ncbi:hypothetical protein SRHO_G00200980 [Serrasalmus rhombeus]
MREKTVTELEGLVGVWQVLRGPGGPNMVLVGGLQEWFYKGAPYVGEDGAITSHDALIALQLRHQVTLRGARLSKTIKRSVFFHLNRPSPQQERPWDDQGQPEPGLELRTRPQSNLVQLWVWSVTSEHPGSKTTLTAKHVTPTRDSSLRLRPVGQFLPKDL